MSVWIRQPCSWSTSGEDVLSQEDMGRIEALVSDGQDVVIHLHVPGWDMMADLREMLASKSAEMAPLNKTDQ